MADPAETPASDHSTPSPTPCFICPYCGGQTPDQPRCARCSGLLDPLSRQATQNAMGPWFIRDDQQPHRPGCSYETILALITRGKVSLDSVLRGPTTAQFWYPARRIPGISSKLGVCHACQAKVSGASSCPSCHTPFEVEGDRQTLGLLPIRLIPAPANTEAVANVPTPVTASGPTPHDPPGRRASEPSGVPTIPRTMSSFAVPSATETRLRADLAAARRRSSMLLGVLAGLVLVGVITFAVIAGSKPLLSRQAALPAEPTQTPVPASLVPPPPHVTPAARDQPATSVPVVPVPTALPEPAEPPATPRPEETPPDPRDSELQTLRRTRLP